MKIFTLKRVGVVAILIATGIGAMYYFTPPSYKGPASDHFDGEHFYNQQQAGRHRFSAFLSWMWNRDPEPWKEVTDAQPGPKPPLHGASLRATFVNHSTVLIQTAQLNILTDPIWSERASPVSWAGPKRVRPPGIRFEDLPPIDLVLISHNHYDHMDLPTLKRLQQAHDPLFLVGLGNGVILKNNGIEKVRELDWWQRIGIIPGTEVSGVPAQHFSQRWLTDRNERLWMGYVIHAPEGEIYFAGDTGMGPHFAQIRERFGPMHLSLLPIGAYLPRWFMAPMHTSPQEAVMAHKILESSYSIGIHFGTFRLADDAQNDPVENLTAALEQEQISPENFWVMGFGEGRPVPPSPLSQEASVAR